MSDIIRWVGQNILPHEADVRAWIRRSRFEGLEADDIVQEAYARMSRACEPERIDSPRAYFFAVARNVALEHLRRRRRSPLVPVEDFEALFIVDDSPGPERVAEGRERLRRVVDLMEALPEKVREVLVMRRVEGLSQKAVAQKLGVPESTIEKRTARGLKILARGLERQEAQVISFSALIDMRRRNER
nr:RNA polymerase sigma factor [Brevundimonas diminuta]